MGDVKGKKEGAWVCVKIFFLTEFGWSLVEKVGGEQKKATKNLPTVMESILGAEAKWL